MVYRYWVYLKKMIKSISIVFPIYNEHERLKDCFRDIEKFNKITKIRNIEYIFVDDGSIDNSLGLISQFVNNKNKLRNKIKFKIIKNNKNQGKGAALIKGVKAASKEWVLTIDTDISVSLLEINKWIKNKYLESNYKIYFGSRGLKKSNVKGLYYRKAIGLTLVLICKFFFNIKLHDTQCGFKLYEKKLGKKIFERIIDKRFAHDIEIVLLAKKYKIEIIELPVKWTHKPGSKIHVIKDGLKILIAMIKMKSLTDNFK